jgi:hypothetical protein
MQPRLFRILVQCAVLLGLVVAACAQQPRYSVWRSERDPEHNFFLLLVKEVQQDLGLSQSVLAEIEGLYRVANERRDTLLRMRRTYELEARGDEFERDLKLMQTSYAWFEDRSWAILDESQRRRLYERTLQVEGAFLLDRPKTMREFGITAEQAVLAVRLRREAAERRIERDQANESPGRGSYSEEEWREIARRSAEIAATFMEEINRIPEQVLTPAQLERWRAAGARYGPSLASAG